MTYEDPDPRRGRERRLRQWSRADTGGWGLPLIIAAGVLAILLLWLLAPRTMTTDSGVASRDNSPRTERPLPTVPPNQSPTTAPKQ